MNDLEELAALQPESIKVTINEKEFEIMPFKFRNIFKVLRSIYKLVDDVNPYEDQSKQFFRLLGDHEDEVLDIMCIATGESKDFFNDISLEEGLELALAIWKVNGDFFAQKIQPKLEALGIQMSQDSQLNPEKSTEQLDTEEKAETEEKTEQ